MRTLVLIIFTLILFKVIVEGSVKNEKIRYISTEHPTILYYNKNHVRYLNVTARRRGRSDPFYYVEMHLDVIYEVHNNWTVDFIFYEFLTNRYRRSFVEMHFKVCDLIHSDNFFGPALKQGKLAQPCPYPPGEYHLYNMTIPVRHIPHNFPFTKGRILANVTGTYNKEYIGSAHIDMEIKETRLKTRRD